MYQIWIGKRYIGDLREVTIIDLNTHQTIHCLMTEDQAKRAASMLQAELKRTVNYGDNLFWCPDCFGYIGAVVAQPGDSLDETEVACPFCGHIFNEG